MKQQDDIYSIYAALKIEEMKSAVRICLAMRKQLEFQLHRLYKLIKGGK